MICCIRLPGEVDDLDMGPWGPVMRIIQALGILTSHPRDLSLHAIRDCRETHVPLVPLKALLQAGCCSTATMAFIMMIMMAGSRIRCANETHQMLGSACYNVCKYDSIKYAAVASIIYATLAMHQCQISLALSFNALRLAS